MNSKPEQIERLLQDMSIESKAIIKEIADICWYMRGSITWDQGWRLTYKEREVVRKLIKDRIEFVEKSGLPIL